MAPKEKQDPTWVHCQLIDGKMVCNYCQKEIGERDIHRLKQKLTHARGNVRPCLKVSDDLKVQMLGYIQSYQAKKANNKKMHTEIGRSRSSVQIESDLHEKILSFKESTSFPIHGPGTNPIQKNHPREEPIDGTTLM